MKQLDHFIRLVENYLAIEYDLRSSRNNFKVLNLIKKYYYGGNTVPETAGAVVKLLDCKEDELTEARVQDILLNFSSKYKYSYSTPDSLVPFWTIMIWSQSDPPAYVASFSTNDEEDLNIKLNKLLKDGL